MPSECIIPSFVRPSVLFLLKAVSDRRGPHFLLQRRLRGCLFLSHRPLDKPADGFFHLLDQYVNDTRLFTSGHIPWLYRRTCERLSRSYTICLERLILRA